MAAGGIPTAAGVRYEVLALMYHVPDLLLGHAVTLRYQLPALASPADEVAPVEAFLNDFSVRSNGGRDQLYQVKQNTTSASWTMKALAREGVLVQMYRQYKKSPNADLTFVSNVPAVSLKRLIAAASQHRSLREFVANLPSTLRPEFAAIRQELRRSKATDAGIYGMLQKAKTKHLTDEGIVARLQDFATERYGDPTKFRLVVKDFIERTPGQIIQTETLQAELDREGLFRLPVNLTEELSSIYSRASADVRSQRSLIADVHIPRAETAALTAWINSLGCGKGVAALLDVAGAGKSVILHDLLLTLEAAGTPVLAIKADKLVMPTDDGSKWSLPEALGIAAEPESLLAAMARRHGKAVLIVDQVDALSMTFARDQRLLDLVLRLISRAASIDGVAVVFSCRAFDKEYDPKLQSLKAAREFPIKPLEQEQIELILNRIGVNWKDLTERERVILQQPQHLDLFARVTLENRKRGVVRREVASLQDLYDQLWELVVVIPPPEKVSAAQVEHAITMLAMQIEKTQSLSQPAGLLDSDRPAMKYLTSAGILRHDGPTLSFFHQSFFDYVVSRTFVSTERPLVDYILSSDQGLFQRPIVVHVLTYLRATRASGYLKQIELLLGISGSVPVRYHLRHLAFAWFGQQVQLSSPEVARGFACLKKPSLQADFLLGCKGNAEWFHALREKLASLLDSTDATVDLVLMFLNSVQDSCGEKVYQMLLPRLSESKKWNLRLRRFVARQDSWRSEEAGQCLLWFLENEADAIDYLDFVLISVGKANPELGCRILGVLLPHLSRRWIASVQELEQRRKRIRPKKGEDPAATELRRISVSPAPVRELLPRDSHGLAELVSACGTKTPLEYLALVIPWILDVADHEASWNSSGHLIETASFRLGFDDSDLHDGDTGTALLKALRMSLDATAQRDPEAFLKWASAIANGRVAVLHQILIQILTTHPAEYANWALKYLLVDSSRLQIGSYGDRHRFSGTLIGAIFPHLSTRQRRQFEKVLLSYHPSWEKEAERYAGSSQFELSWDLPTRLLGSRAKFLVARLRRKFKSARPRNKPDLTLRAVNSPVVAEAAESMSLSQWVAMMRRFDDGTGWDREREPLHRGGIVELSRQFEGEVAKHPRRFNPIANMLDERISSTYHAALIAGLTKSDAGSNEVFATALSLAARRPNDPRIERACVDLAEKREKDGIPDGMLALLRCAALESKDPPVERPSRQRSGNAKLDDPLQEGINCVRGRAIRAYCLLALRAGGSERRRLEEAVLRCSADASSGVRACLIDVLPNLLRDYAAVALDAFHNAVRDRPELLGSVSTHQFIYWTTRQDLSRMLPLLRAMAKYPVDETRVAAGRLIALASFDSARAKALLAKCMGGDPRLRQGIAGVFAHNVDKRHLRTRCLNGLTELLKDKDEQVAHAIANVFQHLPFPDAAVTRFTRAFINSAVIAASPDAVARYAMRFALANPKFALEIGERVVGRFGSSITDHSQKTGLLDDDLVNISMAVYSSAMTADLRRRSMDLFEHALKMGSHFANLALQKADR